MDALFKAASDLSGLPSDNLKVKLFKHCDRQTWPPECPVFCGFLRFFQLIFCLLVAYPLGSVYVRIPYANASLRHLFSITISLFFLLGVFHLNNGVAQLVASSAFTYVVAYSVKSSAMPWIVFTVTMAHLTINHIIRAVNNVGYETIEITGAQMVLTMKLTTFAWNIYDGRRPAAVCSLWSPIKIL